MIDMPGKKALKKKELKKKPKKKASGKIELKERDETESYEISTVKGKGEKKVKFAGEFECPHCGFLIALEAGKLVLELAVTAVTEDYFDVKKSSQTKLTDE
jgi:formylmethanofuran dehydrogenase subunit E